MQGFKRNQVDEALAQYFERSYADIELRSRAKRLLDTDRRYPLPEQSIRKRAFYSDEGPGRGNEVLFSEYEAFALLTGLQLLSHHWPQQTVVELLRNARSKLARAHYGILLERTKATHGARPIFLVISSDSRTLKADKSIDLKVQVLQNVIDGHSNILEEMGHCATFLELSAPTHKLHELLLRTSPTKRGRS